MSLVIYNMSNCARINVSGFFRPFIEVEASTSKAVKPGKEQADSDSSSDSDSESDDDEKTGETVFKSPEQVDSNLLAVVKDGDNYKVTYNNDTNIFILSGKFVGDVITYEGKYSSSVVVKKSEVLEKIRHGIEKCLPKKSKVEFYGNPKSDTITVYCVTSRKNGEQYVNVLDRGEEKKVKLDDLDNLGACTMDACLVSRGLTKCAGEKGKYIWKVQLHSMRLKDCPKNFLGYTKFKHMYD